MIRRGVLLAAVSALIVAFSAAQGLGATVVGAAGVTGPTTVSNQPWSQTIDQSGLTVPYVSGVTDLQTYLASSPTHTGFNNASGFTLTNPTVNVDYDLGTSRFVTAVL